VSRELLIIDSSIDNSITGTESREDILEPRTAASMLITMTELGASTLIIQVPILGLSAGGTVGEEEILSRFDEEFSVLGRNIRNLFEAIRTGLVAPSESARYVGELVELSEKGKERLINALVHRDEEGIVSMEKAAIFFGNVKRPGDLQVQLIRSGENGRPGALAESGEYSKALPDRDGVLRRIASMKTVPYVSQGKVEERSLDHIIFGALKTRYLSYKIEAAETGQALVLSGGPDGNDRIIPLDRYGSLLFELPHKGASFRRIGITDFLKYDEADRNLRRVLLEAEALDIFRGIVGEKHPGILYDYALSLRDEPPLSFPGGNEGKKTAWIEARNQYFASLKDFLNGPAEMNLINDCEIIIASEPWDLSPAGETEKAKIIEKRNSLISIFAVLRARYEELFELRNKLESALSSSFCILGSSRDVEASTLLANSILTGQAIKPADYRFLLFGTLFSALFVCLILKSRSPASALGTGLFLTLLVGTGFSLSFILSGFWLDPQVPAAVCAVAVLFSFSFALIAKSRYSRRFRLAYGPAVSRSCLKSVIRAGKPLPSQAVSTGAAVVAIKKTNQVVTEKPQNTRELISFQEKISELFKKEGGTIIGTEGDLVTVCFGSPLEKVFTRGRKKKPANEDSIKTAARNAVSLVCEIARRPEFASWNFGIDIGSCNFAWTAVSGYFALGTPVQKAKVFSRLASRYKAQIVISASVDEVLLDLPAKKLDVLKRKGGSEEEAFYQLIPENM
jgi:class 3 adenylate cyclase